VVRVLAWMLSTRPHLRIAVCAPTGKAAARLKDSIERQRQGLPVTPAVRAALAVEAVTVHRLLGYRPGPERFARGPHHRLDADVLVVDEASMLDLGLADALVQSLPPGARLLLLGDRDQLASVDAGSVLADLVANRRLGGDARSVDFARWADGLFAGDCEIDRTADAWSDALVELRHNFRFAEQPEIAELADALREGDAEAAMSVLDDPARTQVVRVDPPARNDALASWLHPLFEPLGEQVCEDVFGRLDRIERGMRVLTAVRRGPWGVEGLNALAERTLRARGWNLRETWYEGRPVLVLRNAPELGLANGDLGVIARIEGADSVDRMVFAMRGTEPGSWRAIPAAQLPEHETAWSMTVHKSQGSEFERVVLVLPPGRHPLLSRELLYTGVTRARDRVTVVASAETVRAAVEQVERRRSGLGARLTETFRARIH
jgi:exodeoxyribonuclease V alpha subunit